MSSTPSLLSALEAAGQTTPACRVLCAPAFKVEPTVTFPNLFGSPRIVDEQGTTTREPHGTEFEVILSLGLLCERRGWRSLSRRSSFRSTGEPAGTGVRDQLHLALCRAHARFGHIPLDLVDKFSPAKRPTNRRAYTHKLNFDFAGRCKSRCGGVAPLIGEGCRVVHVAAGREAGCALAVDQPEFEDAINTIQDAEVRRGFPVDLYDARRHVTIVTGVIAFSR